MDYKQLLANRSNYGSKRNTNAIKFLVYHYTANDGDTDEANAKYFHNKVVKTSAHWFVDDDSATLSVPEDYVAWAVGGKLQGSKGHKFYQICTNTNSVSIEMCDTQKNGKYDLSDKTRANAIQLGKEIISRYGITKEHVIRHFDVTGKICPKYFVENENEWEKFKNELFVNSKQKYTGTSPSLGLKGYLKKGDKGEQVKNLQRFLNWATGSKLSIDGSFGDKTRNAVIKYQSMYGLVQDGYFGKKSLAKSKTIAK